jgi:hypothetical protein
MSTEPETQMKTKPQKTQAQVVHRYMLRVGSGNVLHADLTAPVPGQPTRYEFKWLKRETVEDEAMFDRWRESVRKELSELSGGEILFADNESTKRDGLGPQSNFPGH